MVRRIRARSESRSTFAPLQYRFTSSSGVTTVASFVSSGYSQITNSYRTESGLTDIAPSNRQEYNTFLAENGYKSKYDNGHPFDTEKRSLILSHPSVTLHGSGRVLYQGPLYPLTGVGSYTPVPAFDLADASSRLVNKAIPTNPLNSAAVSLGELILPGGIPKAYTRELLEAEFKAATRSRGSQIKSGINSAGDFYLNAAFGYAPIVSDFVSTVNTIREGSRRIGQLERDSGRLVRRRRSLPSIVTQSGPTNVGTPGLMRIGYNVNADTASLYPSQALSTGVLTSESTTHQDIWFSGGFEYKFDKGENFSSQMSHIFDSIDKLTGISVTPERIYQLTPWTWLVDWNASLGTVISNAQRFSEDGLVMRYGYVMRKTVTNNIFTLKGIRFKSLDPGPISVTRQIVRKERFRGDPFGFSTNPSAYTSRQWAVLTSLGMTQGTGFTLRGR